ncbi:MAG: 50S ribosomal protein L11 methyltransferase [Bauldia sp.]
MTAAARSRKTRPPRLDPLAFIRENTRLAPVPSQPDIRIHMAHEATGLWRIAEGSDPPPPYWAFPWAGGLALARYVADHPEIVRSRRILDLGTGSGLVAIAAMKQGAASALAGDVDPYAVAAATLNAAANDVAITVTGRDLTGGPPPAVDVVLVGDLFYEAALAARVARFLDGCLAAGIEVLVGDPHRAYLPLERLRLIAEYAVPDVGDVEGRTPRPGAVFAFVAAVNGG